jgi:hypothetical protein
MVFLLGNLEARSFGARIIMFEEVSIKRVDKRNRIDIFFFWFLIINYFIFFIFFFFFLKKIFLIFFLF